MGLRVASGGPCSARTHPIRLREGCGARHAKGTRGATTGQPYGILCCTGGGRDLGRLAIFHPYRFYYPSRNIMLTRRELLARGSTVLLLVPIISCSTSNSGPSCSGTNVLSSRDASHTHTVCVLSSNLTSPPAGGVTYTTSNEGGHTHQLTLAQADLTALNADQTLTVACTSDVDPANGTAHIHNFTITKGDNTGNGGGGGDPGGW